MERGLQPDERHQLEVTEPTPIQIGLPLFPPAEAALAEMHEVCGRSGAQEVYWFWIGICDEVPHLGLAVAPFLPDVVRCIGESIQPLWYRYQPQNPAFAILPLDDSPTTETIRSAGRVLYQSPPG